MKKIRKLKELPAGERIFIDANIFHLYLRGPENLKKECKEFLQRVETGEIIGYTSPLVLDELAYKLLLKIVEERCKRNPLEVIRENTLIISSCASDLENGIFTILGIENLEIVNVTREHVEIMIDAMQKYFLLPRDAMHIAVMRTLGCRNIASIDSDFDRVPKVIRWIP